MRTALLPLLSCLAQCFNFAGAFAQSSTNQTWAYRLVEGSYLVDDCLICERPTIQWPLRGTFNLALVEENPLFRRFAVRDINFVTRSDPPYVTTGQGTYQIGGEVALRQDMVLDVEVNGQRKIFTNDVATVERREPMIEIHLVQTNQDLIHFFSLDLVAAPVREIWFSTAHGMTTSNSNKTITFGDLISFSGRVVKSNADLVGHLGFMPPVPTLGIDAVDIASGGEILFSLNDAMFSEKLGQIGGGDVLSDRGRIVLKSADLMANFAPKPSLPDYGLDALMVMPDGEILFSITTNLMSATAGGITHGDILSYRVVGGAATNRVYKTNQQLLSAFRPANAAPNYGLDALYVWPSGEIWFSTETGFNSQIYGPVSDGDLLSDRGKIIFRNLELVSAFAPVEALTNFGLDALFIVTDVTAPVSPPKFLNLALNSQNGNVPLNWDGPGKVFQLEKAPDVVGPYLPITPIMVETNFTDVGTLTNSTKAFYRIRQW
ncbi:MAG: hypothetical protein DME26_16805 [Verrucomicrobia bacterium]|nr:MAG: hypothetical protein DME26_16805 [Verrucomicrobiota bacterium]